MTAEHTIQGLEQQLAKALAACDADGCAALLDEEFTAIHAVKGSAFEITLRDQWITAVAACAARSLNVDDTVISLHGDVAIVTVLISETGALRSQQLIVTDVWRRGAAEWKLLERHGGGQLPGVLAASDSAA